jgi:hypothetical protein
VDLIWVVPLAVLFLGLIPVLALAGRVATELRALRGDLDLASSLRPALVEVRDDAELLRRRAAALRQHR